MAEPMTPLTKFVFIITLVWVVVAGLLVPLAVVGILYGKTMGWIAGLIGGAVGYLIHRFAWTDDAAPEPTRRAAPGSPSRRRA